MVSRSFSRADEPNPAREHGPKARCVTCGALVSILVTTGESVRHRENLDAALPLCKDRTLYPEIVESWRLWGAQVERR